MAALVIVGLGACGGLSGLALPLGYDGDVTSYQCKVVRATGSLALDEHHQVRTVHEGHGEVECEGQEYPDPFDVRRPAKVEIEVLGHPREGVGWYAYASVLDADGHYLAVDDHFVWTAQHAEIHPGSCGARESGNCGRSWNATFYAHSPWATITARYRGVTGSITFAVLPKR
jgi:hypothetical protein